MIPAAVATVVLTAMGVLQILVATGRPYGAFVYGGQHRVLPSKLRITSAVAVALYAAFAALLWARIGVLPGEDHAFIVVLTWVLFAYFTFGIALNAISRSPAERYTATPACLVLSICTLLIALSG